MGNFQTRGAKNPLLDPEPSWKDYYAAEWRSERSRELDRHGGPGRPPVARGDSVTAKLVFLEGALRQDQRRMKHVLQIFDDEDQKREQQGQKGPGERLPDFILNTELRAYERLASADGKARGGSEDGSAQQQQRDFSLLAKDPELRRKMMEQRKKMLEYAKGINVVKGAPAIKPLNLPAIKSKVATNWKPGEEHGEQGGDEEGGAGGDGSSSPSQQPPAEWRVRMHAARRRAMLLVGAMARWQVAMARRPGPKRLPRVSSFSYYIPQVLGVEARRFIEEASVVAKIKEDAARTEEAGGVDESAGAGAESGAEPNSRATVGGMTPDRAAARGPHRRGMSDSGISPGAAAAAVAAEAAGGMAAAGGGGPGPLASGVVRPRRRPELRKSSSLLMGRSSDVESYGQRRRPHSSRLSGSGAESGSTHLPAIGGRVSSSGVPLTGASAAQQDAPRQPRGKLTRISSTGQGRARRRRSDGVLATALPPGIAAAAAAGASVLAAAGSGGSAAASRLGSAVGSPLDRDRRRGGAVRPRVSDTGALARMRREASETGCPVGSPSRGRVATGGGGGGAGNATRGPPKRQSEAGTLATAGSAPPEPPSAVGGGDGGSGGSNGGFLPRISISNVVPGSAAGNGGGGTSAATTKPLTLAQARRMALLAEAGALNGSTSDDGGCGGGPRTSVGMSPSRLGPLKLPAGASANTGGGSRSPDKLPLSSPGTGTSSILDVAAAVAALRQSRDGDVGGPAAAGGGGVGKDLREVLREATGGGGGGSLSSAAGSPLGSPGLRHRGVSLDSAAQHRHASPSAPYGPSPSPMQCPNLRRGLVSAPDPAALGCKPQHLWAASDSHPSATHHQSLLGPPPPSGHPSPLPPVYVPAASPSAAPLTTQPDIDSNGNSNGYCSSNGNNGNGTDDEALPPISPTVPLPPPPLFASPPAPPPPPSQPPHLRPLVGAPPSPLSPGPTTTLASAAVSPGPSGKPPLGPGGERVRSGRVGASSHPSSVAASVGIAGGAGGGSGADTDTASASRLAKAEKLMSMYANRVNATWAESQQWTAPTVLSVSEQELFCSSDAWVPYKVTVQRLLKSGALAVHIDACADAVQLADGSVLDLWTSDPWVVAQRLRPGSLPLSERLEGLSLGARILHQLVLAVEGLAGAGGREAVGKMTVVLAINDDQRNAVVADIIRRRWYGLKPENLILTAQRKRCGYRYDKDSQAFLEDPSTPAQVLGSGYALCQLAWLGDAFSVTREGELAMLMGRTLMERFADGRVEWLVGRRARDLALLGPEGVLDLAHLAYCLWAADRHSGNMVLQVAPAASVTIPRAYDSNILAVKSRPASANSASASASSNPPTPSRTATVAASAAGVEGGGGSAGVVDLPASELSSPVMVEALAGVRRQAGHEGWVGLQRFVIHVPMLHGILNTLGIFRPKLTMCGDVARLSLHLGDLTADRRMGCVAVQARTSPAILTSPNEVDDLIPLLLAQDRSASFRDIVTASAHGDDDGEGGGAAWAAANGGDGGAAAAGTAAGGGAASGGGPAAVVLTTKPGIRILLFVAANDVTQLAVNLVLLMARPGRDVVHLVTVVHNSLQMPTGQALLVKYLNQISNAMIEAHAEVLVKGVSGLLEVMEGAASRLAPNLVVLASSALTLSNLNTASVMGSVTLSVLKRLTLPVAVVTSNSKHLVLTQRRTALRCMVLVEPTSRPALHFLCSSCMEPMRGDKLVLAGHHPTRQMTTQQQQTQRRLVDNFADIASSHRFHSPYKLQLDGPVDKALAGAAEQETVHLVGLQVPLGTKGVPGQVLGLIRSCKGGVLVFRDTL